MSIARWGRSVTVKCNRAPPWKQERERELSVMRHAARIEAGTDETAKRAQPVGREPDTAAQNN